MLKTSFELLTTDNHRDHPVDFLSPNDTCYAFAKADRGYCYLVRSGSTWKIYHVTKRNQKTAETVWRRHAPHIKPPLSDSRLIFFEESLLSSDVKIKKPTRSRWPRDYQSCKVFNWERRIVNGVASLNAYIDCQNATTLSDTITSQLKIAPIKVMYLKQRKNTPYGGFSTPSCIQIIDANIQTVLHELAHSVHAKVAKDLTGETQFKHSHHGPQFTAIYAALIKKYGGWEEAYSSLIWDEIDVDKKLYDKLCELLQEESADPIDSNNNAPVVSTANTSVS